MTYFKMLNLLNMMTNSPTWPFLTLKCTPITFILSTAMIVVTTVADIASLASLTTFDHCSPVTHNLTCPWEHGCLPQNDFCHCDDFCEFYGDCCHEFTPENKLMYNFTIDVSCKFVAAIDSTENISIVDSCPKMFQDVARKDMCEKGSISQGLLTTLPVSDQNGLLFQNVFCALCNGIQSADILFWKANIWCRDNKIPDITELKQAIHDGNCSIEYWQPDRGMSPRKCFEIISKCPSGYQDWCIKFHCEKSNFTRHVYGLEAIYKNEHCAICNHNNSVNLNTTIYTCIQTGLRYYDFDADTWYPLSIIMDFNIAGGSKVGYSDFRKVANETTHTCEAGFIFDFFQNECIHIYCAPGFVPMGKRCISPSEGISDCVRRILAPDEYEVFDNGTVVDTAGQSFNASQYVDLGNNTIGVCINEERSKLVVKFDKAQTILSMVGQCISIICLTIHLIVYSILPQLRNPPGKSLMALVASLLTAQVLFLFGVGQTDTHELCVFIGVIIHYSFLASFFWMGIMSFDIWATFSKSSTANTYAHQSNKFLRYSVTGFGSPLVIVVISVMLNFIHGVPKKLQTGYGDGLCWITQRTSLIVFFGAPIICITFSNIIFYCLTIRALYKISQVTKAVCADSSDRQRFWLYVKLSTIMGLTWIFGLVAVLADNQVVWYIFLIFNTLQGAFICISFICTKKVISLLEEKFRHHHSDTTESDGTRSTDLSRRQAASTSSPIRLKRFQQNHENQLSSDA